MAAALSHNQPTRALYDGVNIDNCVSAREETTCQRESETSERVRRREASAAATTDARAETIPVRTIGERSLRLGELPGSETDSARLLSCGRFASVADRGRSPLAGSREKRFNNTYLRWKHEHHEKN